MKILKFRGAVCSALVALFLISCPIYAGQADAVEYTSEVQTPDIPVLRKIEIVDLPASTQILLETGSALKYTSFTLMDPPRLVVDLPGVSLGEFTKPIVVGKGSVIQIDLVEADTPVRIARLNIRLTSDTTEPQIFSKSNVLIIDVPKAVSEQDTAAAPVETGLNMMRELVFNESGNMSSIKIIADKDINAETFIVEGEKLVIDVKDADNSIKPFERIVESERIARIRIGLHPAPVNKVRFVADLKQTIKYDVDKQGKELTVNVYSKEEKIQPAPQVASAKQEPAGENAVGDAKPSAAKPDAADGPKAEAVQKTEPARKVEAPPVPKEKKVASTPQPESAALQKNNSQNNIRKVSLDFQDADVVNVLRLLAEVSKLNMIIGDNVKGKITIKMLDIPWNQALDIILKMKGLGKIHENNVVRIDTLSNIAQQQEEEARAKDAMVRAEDLVTRIIPVNYARAKEVADSLKKTLSARGDITIDDRTNTLIVKDVADKHEEIINLLKTLDKPTPQVLIEARIVQADTNFAKDLGVQWGGDYSSSPGDYSMSVVTGPTGTVTAPSTGFAVNLPASGVAGTKGSVGFTIGKTVGDAFNLDLRLSAGETKGLTKILSAPKIATLDNREAIIQQGESIPYKTYSQEGTKTEFIDATLTLKVTPKVTPDGHISMNIKITKNRQGSIVVEGTPSINKKEATTEVLVRDGETTVIGGIYELSDSDNASMIPWIHQIPVLGWLFKNKSTSNIKSELLIFITPKIIPVTS